MARTLSEFRYTTPAGNDPVGAYIEAQSPGAEAMLRAAIEAFCEEFPQVESVSIKPLVDKIWELRVRDQRGIQHRILYAVVGKHMVLLHAFMKKTQKTPPNEIRTAQKRLEAVTS